MSEILEETAETGRVLTCKVGMRWGDMDAYGHVNNVEILRILEEARIHAFGPPGGTGGPGPAAQEPLFSPLPGGTPALVVEHPVRHPPPPTDPHLPLDIHVLVEAPKPATSTT